ncbi:pilus assembly protein CpaB [Paramixta manurensis]|uniref:Pilus assembly protein CpaB n=1 Tax=Paramixta manurensis TaxID=2740817 RepID=A0A6M8UDG1_9GAMM|nr:pilus assembly protein CpaB [Erwiniaceae bacterium PD-1]
MNHRVLFFLSIMAIGVGVAGIFLQQQKNSQIEHKEEVKHEDAPHSILVAKATRDLRSGDILAPQDYEVTSLKSSSTVTDPRDISSAPGGNIRGYLVTNNTQKGSELTLSMLLSPSHPDYARRSLGVNEMPYSFPITSTDNYLLSSTKAGDKLALYIRIREVEKGKTEMVGLADEGASSLSSSHTPKYVVSRIFEQVTVLDSKRFETAKESESRYAQENKPIGMIVLRLNQKQLAILRTIEKSGQLFLLPDSTARQGVKRIGMDDVLPQLRSVKELRGKK